MGKVALIVSILLNVVLLTLLGMYLFTPYLDFSVLNTSIPRLCGYIETHQPEVLPSFCAKELN